jgi:anti-sigma-K factor RskA
MSHIDPERLALLAMGEPANSPEVAEHLAHCAFCVDDLAALRHAAVAGRASLEVGRLESPPESVWQRISDELALGSASPPTQQPAPPPPVAHRRRARAWRGWVLAAAIVFVAGAGLGTWALVQQRAANSVTDVAEASLSAFPEHQGAAGSAIVEEKADGSLALRIELSADAAPDTYREVWLITSDASALVSLGVLDGTSATLPVPAGVDLRDYVLVDISQEPVDGDPTHSGDSIVRGELTFL